MHDGRFHIFAHYAHYRRGDPAIDPVFGLFLYGSAETPVLTSVTRDSDGAVLLN